MHSTPLSDQLSAREEGAYKGRERPGSRDNTQMPSSASHPFILVIIPVYVCQKKPSWHNGHWWLISEIKKKNAGAKTSKSISLGQVFFMLCWIQHVFVLAHRSKLILSKAINSHKSQTKMESCTFWWQCIERRIVHFIRKRIISKAEVVIRWIIFQWLWVGERGCFLNPTGVDCSFHQRCCL